MPVHVEGIEDAILEIDKLKTMFRSEEIRMIFQTAGDAVAARARDYVPIDTGNLRDAIFARAYVRDTVPQVLVGVDKKKARYGVSVEFGTQHMPAQPFLRRAAGEMHDDLLKHVGVALRKLVEDTVKK